MDRVDDLGVVDALEVDRGDAEAGVPELALDSSGWTEAAVERNRRQRFIWATGPV
jgi:hypothetical protein